MNNDDRKADLNNRIKQIRINIFSDNNREFAKQIGEIEQTISQICLGKRNAGIEVVKKIVENIPTINANWLLTGIGEMIIRKESNKEECHNDINLLNMVSLDKYEKKVEECVLLRAELATLKKQAAKYAQSKGEYSGIMTAAED